MSERTTKPARPWALRLLPPFPAVANRVLAMVGEEDAGARRIGEVIQLDPTFTAEILRVANSALFGAAREVTSITLAVGLLGLERVKAMATLIALNSMVKTALRIEALRKCWMHSLVTAILAETNAAAFRTKMESAYTAGLLHNLGSLGLMAAYPEEYARMLDVTAEHGFDLVQTERDLFEIDHCAAGALLAEEWDYPKEIGAVIGAHHDEPTAGDLSPHGLVRISWRLADALGYVAFPTGRPWTYDELVALIPGAGKSWLGGGIYAAKNEVDSRLNKMAL